MLNYILDKLENMEENNNMYFYKDEVNELGFILRKSTKLLQENEIRLSATTTVNFATFTGMKEYLVILVDEDFSKLSRNEQEFLLWHELGHNKYHKDSNDERNIKEEYEADEYSAENIGYEKAIQALIDIEASLIRLQLPSDLEEVELRIENLRNKSIVSC